MNHQDLAWTAEVPFLCAVEYDGLEFSSYPARRGWNKERLLNGDLTEHTATETAAFLQTWLFFGALTETLGCRIQSEDFKATLDSGKCIITTEKLGGLIKASQKRGRLVARITSMAEFWKLLPKVAACLEEVTQFLRFHVWYVGQPPPINRVPQEALPDTVLLSILLLTETIDTTYNHFTTPAKSSWTPYTPDVEHTVKHRGFSPLLLEKLKENGCCWNDIDRLVRSSNNSALYYASTLPRNPQIVSHHDCTMKSCIANTIDEDNYQVKHTPDCHNPKDCQYKGPDLVKVNEILQQGTIPVLRIINVDDFESSNIELVVDSINPGSAADPFVAISHVWSDGRGNPSANELPICQLRRIQQLVDISARTKQTESPLISIQTATKQVPYNGWAHKFHGVRPMAYVDKIIGRPRKENMPFWMDTILVPLDPDSRRLAISGMGNVYASANSVLVLDAELEALSAQLPARELLTRMQTSGWMRRMWTLQEGALGAWNLQLQLDDGIFHVGSQSARLWRKWWSQSLVIDSTDLYISSKFQEFADLRKSYEKPLTASDHDMPGLPSPLATALLAFEGRSTSKAEDAYICLALMLGMKPATIGEISRLPAHKRTYRILQETSLIPPSFIFSPGEKLQEHGHRWATNPLWETEINNRNSSGFNRHTLFDPSIGLKVCFPGFIISTAWAIDPTSPRFYFLDRTSGRWFKATYDASTGGPITAYDLESRDYVPLQTELAIIVLPLKLSSDAELNENFGNGSHSPGALVVVNNKEGDAPWEVPILPGHKMTLNPYKGGKWFSKYTIYCTYLRRVVVQLVEEVEIQTYLGSRWKQNQNTAVPLRDRMGDFPDVGVAEQTWEGDKSERPYAQERDQKWCIS